MTWRFPPHQVILIAVLSSLLLVIDEYDNVTLNSILKCAVQTKKNKPDGWIVKLFSMLISSKHTGTGSFWIKKNIKKWREIIILGSFLFVFLCEHNKQCDSDALNVVRSVYLWSEYRAVALPSIRTANCDWWFGWSLHPDLLCSSLHKSWFVLAPPGGRIDRGEVKTNSLSAAQ